MDNELTIAVPRPNALQRANQRIASLRPVAFVFRHTFHHVDRLAVRVLGGRTMSGMVAGLPNILLTTTGARTGKPRQLPLTAIPVGSGLAVVGTRFGSQSHPGWYYNLRADPRCVVEVGRSRIDAVARLVPDGQEYQAIAARAAAVYSGFAIYQTRITARRVPIFVLEPAGLPH